MSRSGCLPTLDLPSWGFACAQRRTLTLLRARRTLTPSAVSKRRILVGMGIRKHDSRKRTKHLRPIGGLRGCDIVICNVCSIGFEHAEYPAFSVGANSLSRLPPDTWPPNLCELLPRPEAANQSRYSVYPRVLNRQRRAARHCRATYARAGDFQPRF
jgi:hypothetical protein